MNWDSIVIQMLFETPLIGDKIKLPSEILSQIMKEMILNK